MSHDRQQFSTFRFYEELNDFLSPERRKIAFDYAFNGTPSVKDCIEAIGVPHPEVDLILVDGVSMGFDTSYDRARADHTLAAISTKERRILLTRDKGLLKRKAVTRGYWLRNTEPRLQIAEVVEALDLYSAVRVFSRCMVCNHTLETVDEAIVRRELPAGRLGRVSRCPGCGRLYWPGSHYDRLVDLTIHLISSDAILSPLVGPRGRTQPPL